MLPLTTEHCTPAVFFGNTLTHSSPSAPTRFLYHIANVTSSEKPSWPPLYALPILCTSVSKHFSRLPIHVCVHFLHTCLSVSKIASTQISFLPSPELPVLAEHRVAPKKIAFPLQLAGRMCAGVLAVHAEFPVKVRSMPPPTFLPLLAGLQAGRQAQCCWNGGEGLDTIR